MASYLLRADDSAMARWKAEAKIRALPFSEFIRKSLDRATSSRARVAAVEAVSGAERLGPDGLEAASTGETVTAVQAGHGSPAAGTDPPAAGPVDLQQQARELAGKMRRT